jgi:CheY-like chemotaxis protein
MIDKKIMIIDDDEAIRESIADVLEMEQYQVIQAQNGKDALLILTGLQQDDLPGMIILDMMMPIMDGYMFIEEVSKNHQETIGKIPIILASANANFTSLKEVNHPVVRVKKPFDLKQILEVAEKFCGKPS